MKCRLPLLSKLARLTAVSLLLSACTSAGPEYRQPPTPLPAQWGEADSTVSAAQNVSMLEGFALFADPQLLALQRRALDNNADVQIALLRFASSRVQRNSASAQNQPLLMANAAASRQRQSESGSATRLITAITPASQLQSLIDFIRDPFALYQAGFDASWEPD